MTLSRSPITPCTRRSGRTVPRRCLQGLALLVCAVACSGCLALAVGAAAGAGGAVYVMGKLEEEVNHAVPVVHKAAAAALKDLGLTLLRDDGDKLTAKLESEFADNKHVWVDLESITDKRTRITIRVGLMGDEVRSRKILEMIHKRLPSGA